MGSIRCHNKQIGRDDAKQMTKHMVQTWIAIQVDQWGAEIECVCLWLIWLYMIVRLHLLKCIAMWVVVLG